MKKFHGMSGAGSLRDQISLATNRHIFVSYERDHCLPLVASVCDGFALDNGAYSSWKKGEPYDFSGFIDFVTQWSRHPSFEFVVVPDIIGGTEDENDHHIEKFNLSMVDHKMPHIDSAPVWHLDEGLDRLDRLVDGHRLICLGGSPEHSLYSKPWYARIDQAFSVICDQLGRPRCKVHGLRMLNPDCFSRYPFHSADSTNAERNGGIGVERFGQYPAATRGQRSAVIAGRIESAQSSSTFDQTHKFIGIA